MNNKDLEDFTKQFIELALIYGKTYTDLTIEIYWNSLKKYDIKQVLTAFHRHVTNPDRGQFMPKPADLIFIIEGSSASSSACAWTKLEQAIGSPGVYCDVCFDDAIINKVVFDLGGWVKLGNTDAKEWPFVEKDFKDRYSAYKARGALTEYPKQLTGIANAANSTGGFPPEPVRLVGNQALARLVHEGGKARLETFAALPYFQKAETNRKELGDGASNADSAGI